jgi:hypothetical protein
LATDAFGEAKEPAAEGGERKKRERLPRAQWLQRELDKERAKKRFSVLGLPKRQAAIERLKDGQEAWGPGRTKALCRTRATVRGRVVESSATELRRYFVQLIASTRDKQFAIAIKRICRNAEWALEDMCSRRVVAALDFLRELAIPHRWIPRTARAYRRGKGLASLEATLDGMPRPGEPGWTPCVRAVSQSLIAGVIAAPGRPNVDRATVRRVMQRLVDSGVVQSFQVPQDEADPFEIGDSGWPTNRYYLAYADSPKPALLQPWGDDGELAWLDVLDLPWLDPPQPAAASSPPAA